MSDHISAAEWQWSVPVPGVAAASETSEPPRAFLWIPPECERVRGLVVGQHAMAEELILEHAIFRAALNDLSFAAIWITPPLDLVFDFERGIGAHFDAMLKALADESGYTEIRHAPVVPLGHSAAASFPWNFARWAPERTLAVLSISGQWPTPMENAQDPLVPELLPEGVPGLVSIGEYEWADERAAIGLRQRAAYPKLPLTMLGEAGGGHFEASVEKIAYLALYLRKAAAYRLPAESVAEKAPRLRFIDPVVTGWSVDRWRQHEPTRVPAAPVAEYAEPEEAFWCFDEEHAIATEKFQLNQRGKRVALLGFVQDGSVLPQIPGTHQQVIIPFRPADDGVTFTLRGTFLDTVPAGRPERWASLKAGAPIGHPASDQRVEIKRICGPVRELAPGVFSLRFDRAGTAGGKRNGEIWLAATYPGDAIFKRSIQQGVLRFPWRNEEGAPQIITFAEIPNQSANGLAERSLRLTARSDAGVRVHYYVREGPADVVGDELRFTKIPRRAKLPIKVTIVAWQWGRTLEPKLRTAQPVMRTFLIEA